VSPRLVAIEATGGFETVVAAGVAGAGLPLVVVNPAQVRAFAHALGKRAKTGPIDAAVIAHFAEATKPQVRQLPDESTQMLADLVARRRQIVEMIVAESQRARRVTSERLKKSIARLRKALEKELSDLDGEIGDHGRGTPAWAEKEDLLASVHCQRGEISSPEISDQTIQTVWSVFQVPPQPSPVHLLAGECRKLLDLLAEQHSSVQ
jgi:transposase